MCQIVSFNALLVEDDDATARVIGRLLQSVGISVRRAKTVAAGIEELQNMPALIVLDLMLPDGTGAAVLQAVREVGLQCKVAVVSGADDSALFVTVRSLHPDAIFGKPLDFEDFVDWWNRESNWGSGRAANRGPPGFLK